MNIYDATETAYKNGYKQGMEDAVQWILVKDRLPTQKDANGKGYILAFCKKEGFVNKWKWDCVVKYRRLFSHWMPMPKPPKEENKC